MLDASLQGLILCKNDASVQVGAWLHAIYGVTGAWKGAKELFWS